MDKIAVLDHYGARVPSHAVANAIIRRVHELGGSITPKQLTCVMYRMYVTHVQLHGQQLFDEQFCALSSGATLPSIRDQYRGLRYYAPISYYMADAVGHNWCISLDACDNVAYALTRVWEDFCDADNAQWQAACRDDAWRQALATGDGSTIQDADMIWEAMP